MIIYDTSVAALMGEDTALPEEYQQQSTQCMIKALTQYERD